VDFFYKLQERTSRYCEAVVKKRRFVCLYV